MGQRFPLLILRSATPPHSGPGRGLNVDGRQSAAVVEAVVQRHGYDRAVPVGHDRKRRAGADRLVGRQPDGGYVADRPPHPWGGHSLNTVSTRRWKSAAESTPASVRYFIVTVVFPVLSPVEDSLRGS